ncbi:MAG: hypothetical protein WAR37_00625 [Candidatus Microsaccharimonas sp.]
MTAANLLDSEFAQQAQDKSRNDTNDPFSDIAEMQRTSPQRVVADEVNDERSVEEVSDNKNTFLKAAAGVAAASILSAGVSVVASGDAIEHDKTKETVASTSFTPSLVDGSLYSSADEAVDRMLDEIGLDQNIIDYDKVMGAVDAALDNRDQARRGETFNVDLTESSGVVTGKTYDITISSKLDEKSDLTK